MILYTSGIDEKQQKLKTIKCPKCKRGRVCDVSFASKIRLTHSMQNIVNNDGNGIFIKCPKCGIPVIFSMQN